MSKTIFYRKTSVRDGVYQGFQTGYEVTIRTLVLQSPIVFKTANGLRGVNIPVTVTVKDGQASVEVQGNKQ